MEAKNRIIQTRQNNISTPDHKSKSPRVYLGNFLHGVFCFPGTLRHTNINCVRWDEWTTE